MNAAQSILFGFPIAAAFAVQALAQTPLLTELRGMLPLEPDATRDVALGDLDGDGDLDAFVGDGDKDRLILNDGWGGFTDASGQLPTPTGPYSYTTSVVLGDVDADGDLDVLIGTSWTTVPDRLYLNDGSGVFSDGTGQLPSIGSNTGAVALGDVDGDGDLDALLGNYGQSHLFFNDGFGSFSNAPFPTTIDSTQAIALGDVDGDGDLDAFFGNYGQDRLFLNDGSGGFSYATAQIPTVYASTSAVAFGDVDSDGDLDALIGRPGTTASGEQNRLYLNNGSGGFSDMTNQLPSVLDLTTDLALADVDGDGDLDAFVANSEQSRLHLNDGSGFFVEATFQLPAHLHGTDATALGDVDGDGDLDAFLGNTSYYDGARNRLYLNDGAGSFVDATSPQPSTLDRTYALVLGDVDADGDLDALLGISGPPSPDRLWLNDGWGIFCDATAQLPQVSDDTRAIAFGDVDGDGDLDALIGSGGTYSFGEPEWLYLNDGSGTFIYGSLLIPSIPDRTHAVALGDLDGDGDLDAVIGNGGDPDRVYSNDGTGVFSQVTAALPFNLDDTHALALGDVDVDGDLDALFGNDFGPDRLYLNDGSGVFNLAGSQLPAIADATRAIAMGDVDGDGDLDALIGNHLEPDRLYLNDGAGVFSDTTGRLPVFLDPTSAVALGDVDEDGDLDALIGNSTAAYSGEQDRLYLNDGLGFFTDATTLLPAIREQTYAIALGDVDGDGDLDALTGQYLQPNLVLSNRTRQLARRGIPRAGKPLTLELNGPVWGTWFLAFSLGTASVAIPPFGTLRLDPLSLNLSHSGILDAQGRASVTLAVPAIPSLIGTTVYWQALVTSPTRFTNGEKTFLTGL
jgi:hypothetical protein